MTTPHESALVSDADAFSQADPEVAAHVVAIRDRFGIHGLRSAAQMIQVEIALAQDAMRGLEDLDEDRDEEPSTGVAAAGRDQLADQA